MIKQPVAFRWPRRFGRNETQRKKTDWGGRKQTGLGLFSSSSVCFLSPRFISDQIILGLWPRVICFETDFGLRPRSVSSRIALVTRIRPVDFTYQIQLGLGPKYPSGVQKYHSALPWGILACPRGILDPALVGLPSGVFRLVPRAIFTAFTLAVSVPLVRYLSKYPSGYFADIHIGFASRYIRPYTTPVSNSLVQFYILDIRYYV